MDPISQLGARYAGALRDPSKAPVRSIAAANSEERRRHSAQQEQESDVFQSAMQAISNEEAREPAPKPARSGRYNEPIERWQGSEEIGGARFRENASVWETKNAREAPVEFFGRFNPLGEKNRTIANDHGVEFAAPTVNARNANRHDFARGGSLPLISESDADAISVSSNGQLNIDENLADAFTMARLAAGPTDKSDITVRGADQTPLVSRAFMFSKMRAGEAGAALAALSLTAPRFAAGFLAAANVEAASIDAADNGVALDDMMIELRGEVKVNRLNVADLRAALSPGLFSSQNTAAPAPMLVANDALRDLGIEAARSGDGSPALRSSETVSQPMTLAASAAPAAGIAHSAAASATAQILAAIQSNGRNDRIEVRLDPPELGRVRIDFIMESGDAVKALVTAERSETLDHLRKHSADLSDQLRQAGFAGIEMSFARQDDRAKEEGEPAADSAAVGASGAPSVDKETIYLSLRDDAKLDLIV